MTTTDNTPTTADGVLWEVRDYNPADPFTATLAFTDADGDLFWLRLDPVTTREITAALVEVRNAQLAAITGSPAAVDGPPTATATVPDDDPEPSSTPVSERPWLRRHRVTAVILAVVALIMIVTFASGASQI